MKTCFNVIRSLIAVILSILLLVVILVGIPLSSLSSSVSNPENVKSWFVNSKIYDNFVESLINMTGEMPDENLPEFLIQEDNKEELSNALNTVITPEWLQVTVERAIDGTYKWLSGESEIPDFEIDFVDKKTIFLDETTNYIKKSLESLPECTEEELEKTENKDFNPMEASCIPPDFNLENTDDLKAEIENQLNESEIYKEGKVESGKFITIDQDITDKVQKIYGIFNKLPQIILVVIAVISLILFITIPGLSGSLLITGLLWLISGSFLIVANLIIKNKFDHIYQVNIAALTQEQKISLPNFVKNLLQTILSDIKGDIVQLSLVLVILGFVFIVGGIILKFSKKRYFIKDEGKETVKNPNQDKPLELGGDKKQSQQTNKEKGNEPEVTLK